MEEGNGGRHSMIGGGERERSRKSAGFRLADPARISSSIPGDLNFVHNIHDISRRQRENIDTDRDDIPLMAVPLIVSNGDALHRAASFSPRSDRSRTGTGTRTAVMPDNQQHHYMNVEDMAARKGDRPPMPDSQEMPVRVLSDGWLEYSLHGRPYFFHPDTQLSQWKPPRLLATPADVNALLLKHDLSAYGIDLHRGGEQDEITVESRSGSQSPAVMQPEEQDSPPLQLAPPLPCKETTSATMTDSVDSGLGRMSLSLRNQAYGLRTHGLPAGEGSYDVYSCSEDLANVIGSDMNNPAMGGGANCSRANSIAPMHFQQQKTIKNGSLDKCKTMEAGNKLRKKEWVTNCVFLTSAHLIFYKDEKSAEKFGKHYPAPLGVCDLRGARLCWVDKERDKRRKHVFQLELVDGTAYLFSTVNSQDINGWFHALRQVIAKLPQPDFYPTPVLEQEHVRRGSLLGRSSSSLTAASSASRARQDSTGALSTDKQMKKSKRKSAFVGAQQPDDEQLAATSASAIDGAQTRDTIIERLRRFFRSRPTIESLKEKGIYKPEPVFGSTLIEICQKERYPVPKFVKVVTELIEAKGLDVDGLYRVSGNLSAIQRIRCQVDQDKYTALVGEDDVHVLTGTLKLFFRELQEPIFPLSMTKDFLNAMRMQNAKQRHKTFEDLLLKMPPCHQETLHLLLKHLARVASHSGNNRMQTHNLAIVFGPTLFSNGAIDRPIDKSSKAKPPKRPSTGSNNKASASSSAPSPSAETVQSNSHLAFNMIMQGQIVEFLLKEQDKFRFGVV